MTTIEKRGSSRRGLTFGIVAVAAVLALASSAFACTVFKGKFSLTQSASTLTNWGNGTGMGFCTGHAAQTKTLTTASSFTVSVTQSTTDCASKLTAGDYQVHHTGLGGASDCMNGADIGTVFPVDSNGSGSKTLAAGTSLSAGDTRVCTTESGGVSEGNEMAVVVV